MIACNRKSSGFNPSWPLRLVALAVMLCAVSALVLPTSAGASGGVCAMACCLEKQTHTDDACEMHQPAPVVKRAPVRDPDDPLCGAPPPIDSSNTETITVTADTSVGSSETDEAGTTPAKSGERSVGRSHMSAPCRTECGAATTSFSQSRKQREIVANVRPEVHRPATVAVQNSFRNNRVTLLPSHHRPTVPRGPPVFPSV